MRFIRREYGSERRSAITRAWKNSIETKTKETAKFVSARKQMESVTLDEI